MELAAAALRSLIPKLGALLANKYKLQKRVTGEIRFLKAEMISMQAALSKVSKLPAHQIDDLIKIWVQDLKELAYDIEDSIDDFMVHVDAHMCIKASSLKGFRGFIDRSIGLLTTAKTRHRIAIDIKDIKSRLHEVVDRRARYNLDGIAAEPATTIIDPRLPALYEDAKMLVGIDGSAQKLTNLLMEGQSTKEGHLMVVSIVGVGGLGKTTLANSVYQRLGGQFECQAFVSVSLKPNLKQIFSSIWRQLSEDKCTNSGEKDLQELIDGIRKFLKDKRYLIVIDDVWNESAWTIIKCALIEDNVGSRVIVTTRNFNVAKLSSSLANGAIYEQEPLSDADSRRLFNKRIFNEDGIHYELEEASGKILKKCGGLPLAIISIASLLASKPNKTKYEWYALCDSIGSGLEKDKDMDNMRGILSLSYGDLPSYLKPCLLYLSIFPEDYVIGRGRLVRRWVAEGFVDKKQGRNVYDVGHNYFNELVNRSMIQPLGIDECGSARSCRVHDVILDLIISLSTEENFIARLDAAQLKSPVCKIRRLSLQVSKEDGEDEQAILPATVNKSHVRSLTIFGGFFNGMPPLSRFSILRVLELYLISTRNIHSKDLGSLQHLRYLALSAKLESEFLEEEMVESEERPPKNKETEFLKEIGNLQLLRTLDLRGARIQQLPRSVVSLRELEYLLVRDYGVAMPNGIGNVRSLQELSWLDVQESANSLVELAELTELRVLSIHGLARITENYIKIFLQSLSNLRNLHTLHFGGHGLCSLDCTSYTWNVPARLQIFNGGKVTFFQLPWWFAKLSELSCLFIEVRMLRQDDLQVLGALPVLRFLQLQVNWLGTADEKLVVGSDQLFSSLVEFQFKHYTTSWLVFAEGSMPKVQRLQLRFPAKERINDGFYIGFENLASLKKVFVQINCEDAWIWEVEDAERETRDAIVIHPNRPSLEDLNCSDFVKAPWQYMKTAMMESKCSWSSESLTSPPSFQ
ncbi:unnamed protein product [Urochloa decumbens]|uniref:Uncharacterized protein n=1 Tax=Urochloa decumbens TaxID=240449 RepID=A0ABC9FN54_9POAL